MKAMCLKKIVSLDKVSAPLELCTVPDPVPGVDELLLKISACGVCHTELDEIEGRTAPSILPIIPGHQVIGTVIDKGKNAYKFGIGTRVGVGWIHSSCGGSNENLSPEFRATGRDVNGGYAELMTVPEHYAYPIPEFFTDSEAAPLLCAGAVGYRALKLAGLHDGEHLGLTGFGGSNHLVLQIAKHLFPKSDIYVFARSAKEREFARSLGAKWAGDTGEVAPLKLHAIIDTTPAWKPVVEALHNLKPGGRLVINAIRKEESDKEYLQNLSYHEHLWMEKEIKSVANVTAADIEEFLIAAGAARLKPKVETYPWEEANTALIELKRGSIRGAKVLLI